MSKNSSEYSLHKKLQEKYINPFTIPFSVLKIFEEQFLKLLRYLGLTCISTDSNEFKKVTEVHNIADTKKSNAHGKPTSRKKCINGEELAHALRSGSVETAANVWIFLAQKLMEIPRGEVPLEELVIILPLFYETLSDQKSPVRENAINAVPGLILHFGYIFLIKGIDIFSPRKKADVEKVLKEGRELIRKAYKRPKKGNARENKAILQSKSFSPEVKKFRSRSMPWHVVDSAHNKEFLELNILRYQQEIDKENILEMSERRQLERLDPVASSSSSDSLEPWPGPKATLKHVRTVSHDMLTCGSTDLNRLAKVNYDSDIRGGLSDRTSSYYETVAKKLCVRLHSLVVRFRNPYNPYRTADYWEISELKEELCRTIAPLASERRQFYVKFMLKYGHP